MKVLPGYMVQFKKIRPVNLAGTFSSLGLGDDDDPILNAAKGDGDDKKMEPLPTITCQAGPFLSRESAEKFIAILTEHDVVLGAMIYDSAEYDPKEMGEDPYDSLD